MFEQLLPQRFDNTYRGPRLALWLLGLLLLMKGAIGLGCIFNGHQAASRADGIPLDTFTPGGVQTVVALFAIWGLSQVLLGLIGTVALTRYRSMAPLVFTLILLEHLGRKLILYFLPVPKTGAPPGLGINLVLFAVEILGLALSLYRKRDATEARTGA